MNTDVAERAPISLDTLRAPAGTDLVSSAQAAESARAVQEVQAALVIAKRFPRDEQVAYNRIMKACQRPTLAESGLYAYTKGGSEVTGASIRLAEAMAQAWGNIKFGWRVLTQNDDASEVEAFAWDMETNVPNTITFTVPHSFKSKGQIKRVTDPREIYELIANQASRRLRAVVLRCIPGDIQDAAVEQCEKTLKAGGGKPLADRVRDMVMHFEQDLGVSKAMIEKRVGKNIEAINETEFVSLRKIFGSLRDGMAKADQFFEADANLSDMKQQSKPEQPAAPKEEPKTKEPEKEPEPAPAARKEPPPQQNGDDEPPGMYDVLQMIQKAKTLDDVAMAKAMMAGLSAPEKKVAVKALENREAAITGEKTSLPAQERKSSKGSLE